MLHSDAHSKGSIVTKPTIVCIVGTRPEAIKVAPVVLRFRKLGAPFRVRLVSSGQQPLMVEQALAAFGLTPDHRIPFDHANATLPVAAGRQLSSLGDFLSVEKPVFVLAQGDTTTVFTTAIASHYLRIPFGHIEAGLRSGSRISPFPEETHRVITAQLTTLHFAPTESARLNLLNEGIDPASIEVTGNTVIDALGHILRTDPSNPVAEDLRPYLLVTFHRRENWGPAVVALCNGLKQALRVLPDLRVILSLHPNPNVRSPIMSQLGGEARIQLIEPVDYPEFVALMRDARLILTDSGGIQEEAPSLGRPVLLARDTTERPEGLTTGLVHFVPLEADAIALAIGQHWSLPAPPSLTTLRPSPFGDGRAAERIVSRVLRWLEQRPTDS
jgi:UDP-N-acetylglucosamine 2-epimerase (non-hydrolysing)